MGAGLPPVIGQPFYSSVGRDIRRQAFGQDCLVPVCVTHGIVPTTTTGLSGQNISGSTLSETQATYRVSYLSLASNAINDLQLVFTNTYAKFDDLGEYANANSISITAVVEYPLNTFFTVRFRGSSSALTIEAGDIVVSDPLPIQIPANTRFYVRTYVSVASGGWPIYQGALTGFNESYLTGVNSLTTASIANTFGYTYGPVAIYGKISQHKPNIYYGGDSRMFGLGDTNGSAGQLGWCHRAISNTYGGTKFCKSSESLNQFINAINTRSKRRQLISRLSTYTHAVFTYPINDLTAGRTVNQITTDYTTLLSFMADLGVATILTTPTPHTTSSGGQWISAADQTVTGNAGQNLLDVITWLMASPANCLATFDANAVLSDLTLGGDRTKWLTDGATNKKYTSDGLHENALGSSTMATAFASWYPSYIF